MNWKFTMSQVARLAGSAIFALSVCPLRLPAADAFVASSAQLQPALNQARPGDTITLQAGVVFTGHFTLAPNPGPQTITIQSSAMSQLPGPGQRVNPSQAGLMPKLVTPDESAVLTIPAGAPSGPVPAYYKIQGIEFYFNAGYYANQNLITVGDYHATTSNGQPHDVDFDRCYIHGDLTPYPDGSGAVYGGKQGITLSARYTTIENSYFSDFTSSMRDTWGNVDTQAITGWNGPGPYRILNNYIESGAENVAFGGAVVDTPNNIPSDILVAHNDIVKPTSYIAQLIRAKNLLELKNAQRVTIDSNNFSGSYVANSDQQGFAMLLNVRTEGGQVPWATVSDITVTNNRFSNTLSGLLLGGLDGASPVGSQGTARNFLIQNNTFADLQTGNGVQGTLLYTAFGGVKNATFDHNTGGGPGQNFILYFWGTSTAPGDRNQVYMTHNVLNFNYGASIFNSSPSLPARPDPGTPTLQYWNPQGSFTNNDIIGTPPSYWQYPGTPQDQSGYPGPNRYGLGSAADATPGQGANLSAPVGLPTGWVQLVNVNSGKCVDVTMYQGSELRPGTRLQQYQCTGNPNQQFQLTPYQGRYILTARLANLAVNIYQNSTANGAWIVQWPLGWNNGVATPDYLWSLQPSATRGAYSLSPDSASGSCLDVTNWSIDNGVPLQQWQCLGGANQQFRLVPVS